MKFHTDLQVEDIYRLYDEYEIFSLIFNEIPDLDQVYLSPFREDKNPSCYFEQKDKLYFVDWGEKTRSCITAIKDYFKLDTLTEVCTFIVSNLNKTSKSPYSNVLKKEYNTVIIPVKKEWTKEDIQYWKQFGISTQELEEDNVLSIKGYFINDIPYITDDLSYSIKISDKVYKIYRPYQSKKYKWRTNASPNDIVYYSYPKDYLIVTKSYKDCRVLRNLGYCAIWLQNEGAIPSDLDYIKSFNKIYIFFDNDTAGINAAYKLNNLLENKGKLIVSSIKHIKDVAEMWAYKGPEYTKNFLHASIMGTDY